MFSPKRPAARRIPVLPAAPVRRRPSGHLRPAAAGLLGLVVLGACGASVGAADAPAVTTPVSVAPVTTTPRPTTTVARGLDDVRAATVQIVAKGAFVDPEVGTVEGIGSGSGFIIDPSGLAVTNNHVVTGAATLNVYVGGDLTRPRNARVLGVSECSDLALIDIDGEGFPTLSMRTEEVRPGLEVYAAGFPLGDPEFTLTKGIVSKARAGGDQSWTSVDHTIEHDANIQPGNSGGPLVTATGEVVGINYAGGASATTTAQFFAIGTQEANGIIGELRSGRDVTSVGINGVAFADPVSGLSGVWVSGVKSGSPADRAGVRGGDVVTKLEGLTMGSDGTMADYCDVLRSHRASDQIRIEVLRFDTGELLEGELNGTKLSVTGVFGDTDGGTLDGDVPYATQRVVDVTSTMQVDVPTAWTDVATLTVPVDGADVPAIMASTDNANFDSDTSGPGIIAIVPPQQDTEVTDLIDLFVPKGCTFSSTNAIERPDAIGQVAEYTGCGGSAMDVAVVVLRTGDVTLAAVGKWTTEAERELVATTLSTLRLA